MLQFSGERIVPDAENCEPTFARKMYQEHLARYLLSAQFVSGKDVLDVGCGVGYGSQWMARHGAAQVCAFDAAGDAIEHAQTFYAHPAVEYGVANAETFNYGRKFDVITCFELIEHVDQPEKVVENLRRHLKDDGVLLISTPRALQHKRGPFHTQEFNDESFRRLLSGHFPHLSFLFENNLFVSHIDLGEPGPRPLRVEVLDDIQVFGHETCDYFVCVASPQSLGNVQGSMVVNGEAYVKLLERDVAVLHRAEDDLKARLAEREKRMENCQADIQEHHRRADELAAQLGRLCDDHHQLTTLYTSLHSEHQAARDQLAALGEQHQRLSAECEALRTEHARLQTCHDRLQAEIKQLQAEIEQLRAEIEQRKSEFELREAELKEQHAAEIKHRQAEFELREARLKERQAAEIRRLEIEFELREAEVKQQQQTEASQLQALIDERDKKIDEAGCRETDLAEQLARQQSEHGRLNEMYGKLTELHRAQTRSHGELVREHGRLNELYAHLLRKYNRRLFRRLTQPLLKVYKRGLQRYRARKAHPPQAPARHNTSPRRGIAKRGARRVRDWVFPQNSAIRTWFRQRRQQRKQAHEATAGPHILPLSPAGGPRQNVCAELKKVMFFTGNGTGESFRYRVANMIEGLERRGLVGRWCDEAHPCALEELNDTSLFVVFRAVISPTLQILFDRCRELSIPIVFDIDDLVFEPQSIQHIDALRNFTPEQMDQYRCGIVGYRQLLVASDAVTCTTEFLRQRIEQLGKPAFVTPNTINSAQRQVAEEVRHRRRQDGRIRIGYFCGSNTHDKDFHEASAAVCRVMDARQDVDFLVVGPLELPAEFARFGSRLLRKELMSSLEMLRELAQVDINIAPLELDNPYTAGKSELKIFEAALVGVPTVASATHSYADCIRHGVDGFAATTSDEWFQALERLVAEPSLREQVAAAAQSRFSAEFDIDLCIPEVVNTYRAILRSSARPAERGPVLDIAWIVPRPEIGSGGHRNIYRAAKHLGEFGHRITFYHTMTGGACVKDLVCENFYDLRDATFVDYRGELGEHDVCFATHWSTAYQLAEHRNRVILPCYFVQDFEPLFYPMGSQYVLAENTYRLGFTHVTSGPWPAEILKNGFSQNNHSFKFPVNTSVYRPGPRSVSRERVLFFARPEMHRRCFDLGIEMLKHLKQRRPRVEIVLFGSRCIDSSKVPFEHTNAEMLPNLAALAELYRNAHLGIAFSTTNPSLVPYEMMACGLAVADMGRQYSELNYGGTDNVFLLNPDPQQMAREIEAILDNDAERTRRARNGAAFVKTFPDEEGMARRIEHIILTAFSGQAAQSPSAPKLSYSSAA